MALKPQVASCAPCEGRHTTSILRQKTAGFGANRGLCARDHGGLGSRGPEAPEDGEVRDVASGLPALGQGARLIKSI